MRKIVGGWRRIPVVLSRRDILEGAVAAGLSGCGSGGASAPSATPGGGGPAEAQPATAALDAALRQFHDSDPEFGGGMSNHGPMASEALETMGYPDRIEPFAARYRERLEPMTSGHAMTDAEFDAAVGNPGARVDLIATVSRRVRDAGPQATLGALVPRLLPGLVAAAFHGTLRTAHAVRAWTRHDAAVRQTEIAHGLGYWAARYVTLPGQPGGKPEAGVSVVDALSAVPLVPAEQRGGGLIVDRFGVLSALPGYAEAVARWDPDAVSPHETLDALSAAAARLLLTNSSGRSRFVYLHAVTGTAAIRTLLDVLSPADQKEAARHLFGAVAAVHATHGEAGDALARAWPMSQADPAALRSAAADSTDDHTIKLVEASLREYDRTGRPELLAAAAARVA